MRNRRLGIRFYERLEVLQYRPSSFGAAGVKDVFSAIMNLSYQLIIRSIDILCGFSESVLDFMKI